MTMKQIQELWSAYLLLGLLCTANAAWQGGLKGDFGVNPDDGAKCSWMECRQGGKGPRLFQVRCQIGVNTYGCVYKGNPHNCAAYNNGGQQKYYNSLATKSGNKRPNGCSYWKLWSNSMCKEIVFENVQPGGSNAERPAPGWCTYQG